MRTFFIVGLPRSRTAWLANLLTYGECFCYHEALNRTDDPEELPEVFAKADTDIVGDADCGVATVIEDVNRLFPEARWVAIHRPYQEALESMDCFLQQTVGAVDVRPAFEQIANGLALLEECGEEKVLHVRYDELDTFEIVDRINDWCTGRRFRSQTERLRVRMLQTMRINIVPEKVISHLTPLKRALWDQAKGTTWQFSPH